MGEGIPIALPVVNHNRDLKSKREDRQEITIVNHDGRGIPIRAFVVNHNCDLKSREFKELKKE